MSNVVRDLVSRVRSSELAMRIASGGFWIMLGALASKVLGLFTSVVLARILGKETLGEFGIVYSTIAMFQTFACFGLGLTATKHVAQFRREQPDRAAGIIRISLHTSIVTGAGFAAVLYILAPWLATHSLAAPQLTGLIRISTLALFLSAVDGAQVGILSGLEGFRSIAVINAIYGVVNLAVMVCGTLMAGLLGAVVGICISQFAKFALNRIILAGEIRKAGLDGRDGGSWKDFVSILWTFSLPAVLTGLFVDPVGWVSNALLVNQPSGYAEMGILSATSPWFLAITFVPTSLAGLALPIFSDLLGRGKSEQFVRVLKFKVLLFGGIALAVAVPVMLMSRYIMGLYGPSFVEGYRVLIMSSVAAIIISILSPLSSAISSAARMWLSLCLNVAWAVVFLVLSAWWIPGHGALGQIAARTAAYAFLATLVAIVVKRQFSNPPISAMTT